MADRPTAEQPRPRIGDPLGLRAAMADRLLPVLVGAMAFLAALALAGAIATSTLAQSWRSGTASALTIQVPAAAEPAGAVPADPGNAGPGNAGGGTAPAQPTPAQPAPTRLEAVLAALAHAPNVAEIHPLTTAETNALLAPWLGQNIDQLAVPLPAVIAARWAAPATEADTAALRARLDASAPGTIVDTGARWAGEVVLLTASLRAAALAVLAIVVLVAAAVVAVAIHAGLAQRREAIEIIHGLGALDGDIAARFAARAAWLAGLGGAGGALAALPCLLALARFATPFLHTGAAAGPQAAVLWASLPALPILAAAIGWGTAQLTVHGWLRRLV